MDDPLLRFCWELETGACDPFSETVNLAPLFTVTAAVERIWHSRLGRHETHTSQLANVDQVADLAQHTPWRPDLGVACTPWDPETILAWAPAQRGHNGLRPTANCIFYGVTFANAVQSIGVAGRCAIWAGSPGNADGHFTAEWWSTEHEKWAMVDPNFDAMFLRDGVPLSTKELQQLTPEELHAVTEHGPGVAKQLENERVVHWMPDGERRARSLENRAVWYRADQLTHPEHSPASHGAGTAYAETGIVWEPSARDTYGMHCYFGDQGYFDAPPDWEGAR